MGKKVVRFNRDLKPAEPKPPAQGMIPFALTILFMDGEQPLTHAALQGTLSIPPEGQGAVLEVRFDARQLLSEFEAKLGPGKSKLWTPGG